MKVLALAFALTATPAAPVLPSPPVRIDHIIVGVSDLTAGMRAFERKTGVKPQVGGVHPGRGTRNAIVSLGPGTYLEIIAPDPAQGIATGMAAELAALDRPTVVGWAIGTDDVAGLRQRLERSGLKAGPLSPGSRGRPDGVQLSWITFELESLDPSVAPFFIAWKTPHHPSLDSPRGCRFRSLRIQSTSPGPLKRLAASLHLTVKISDARQPRLDLSLACRKGTISF